MKNIVVMKNYLAVCATIMLIAASCDDRPDFLGATNNPPSVYFGSSPSNIEMVDSLKNSLKIGQDFVDVTVSAVDREGGFSGLAVESSTPAATFFVSDVEVNPGSIPMEGTAVTVRIKPGVFGNHKFTFKGSDRLGGVGNAVLTLVAFENLAPIARATFTKIAINSPYEFEFNALASRDQDANQGGAIQFYKYVINDDYEILTPNPVIRHVFSGTGGFSIKYSVIDNEGKASEVQTQLITII